MNWDRTLNDLARVLPHDVVLTSLQASAPVTAAAAGAAAAAATDTPAVPAAGDVDAHHLRQRAVVRRVGAVLDRLALLPWLSSVTLTVDGEAGQCAGDLLRHGERLGGALRCRR